LNQEILFHSKNKAVQCDQRSNHPKGRERQKQGKSKLE
jgi:hypothetical protein